MKTIPYIFPWQDGGSDPIYPNLNDMTGIARYYLVDMADLW